MNEFRSSSSSSYSRAFNKKGFVLHRIDIRGCIMYLKQVCLYRSNVLRIVYSSSGLLS
jgi:hypothetical protein